MAERQRRSVAGPAGGDVKLQAVRGDHVYVTAGRRLVAATGDWTFDERGRLPPPREGPTDLAGWLQGELKPLVSAVTGAFPTANVWPVGDGALVATVGRRVLHSPDGGATWTTAARLPASSPPAGVLPPAFCATGEACYLGEYPLDGERPRIRRSTDGGATWETVTWLPDVRHVHAVQADPYTDDVWVTTGDADAECRVGRLVDGRLVPVGGGSQRWRAVELAFTPDAVLWGVDSVYAGSNPILRLDRRDVGAVEAGQGAAPAAPARSPTAAAGSGPSGSAGDADAPAGGRGVTDGDDPGGADTDVADAVDGDAGGVGDADVADAVDADVSRAVDGDASGAVDGDAGGAVGADVAGAGDADAGGRGPDADGGDGPGPVVGRSPAAATATAPDPAASPDLETLHELDSSVFFAASLAVDGTQWVVFATAAESGGDSTAPPGAEQRTAGVARVVAASADTAFREWHELASYDRRRVPADRVGPRAPSATGYAFVGASDERGLVVNPYNTATDHGTLRRFPPAYFAALE